MTFDEFMRFASAIKAYFPKDNFLPTNESKDLWYAELKDIDFAEAAIGLRKYVQTNKFPPTIADIRESVADNKSADEGWSKGWESVQRAIRRFGYYDKEGALKSFDSITAEVVKRLGWKEICLTEQDQMMVLRANFRMVYEQVSSKNHEAITISPDVLESIGKIRIGNSEKVLISNEQSV